MYNMVFCVVNGGTVAETDVLPDCDVAVFGSADSAKWTMSES